MNSAFGWVLFGFAIWGLVILMHALQRRFAPELDRSSSHGAEHGGGSWHGCESAGESLSGVRKQRDDLAAEVTELRERIQVLESIVTDKRYQFDQELNR